MNGVNGVSSKGGRTAPHLHLFALLERHPERLQVRHGVDLNLPCRLPGKGTRLLLPLLPLFEVQDGAPVHDDGVVLLFVGRRGQGQQFDLRAERERERE